MAVTRMESVCTGAAEVPSVMEKVGAVVSVMTLSCEELRAVELAALSFAVHWSVQLPKKLEVMLATLYSVPVVSGLTVSFANRSCS
ncbi:Uncharacterised protein [uncultured archaeon]|nr:Uncharacterised protein [uncultured archaeon]